MQYFILVRLYRTERILHTLYMDPQNKEKSAILSSTRKIKIVNVDVKG